MSVMTVAASTGSMDAGDMPPKPLTVLAITAGSGAQFTFNNNNYTYDDAEIDCQMQGGHLASYDTMQEQKDVESFLVDNVGGLCSRSLLLCAVQHAPALVVISLPAAGAGGGWCTHTSCLRPCLQGILIGLYGWHDTYWIGLRAVPRFPNFIWADPTVTPLASAYDNWGLTPAGLSEPIDSYRCGGARKDRPSAANPTNYGWASMDCEVKMPYVCRLAGGEWPRAPLWCIASCWPPLVRQVMRPLCPAFLCS